MEPDRRGVDQGAAGGPIRAPGGARLRRTRLFLKMARTVREHGMLSRGDRVLVGLSAGPDSSALLHALTLLAPRYGLSIEVAHVHHGLRGTAADRDARVACSLAEGLGLPFVLEKVDVRAHAAAHRVSIEMAARTLRLFALESIASRRGCGRIALGHTADDQAETVMMWALRGTSPSGLAGIPPVRGRLVRPLLAVWRREVLAYCERAGLSPVEDESNRSVEHLRNRIRWELFPFIEEKIWPGARDALVRLSRIAADEDAFMAEQAEATWQELGVRRGDSWIGLPMRELAGMHPAIQRRILVRALEEVSPADLRARRTLHHVEALRLAAMRGRGGASVELPGVLASTGRGWLILKRTR